MNLYHVIKPASSDGLAVNINGNNIELTRYFISAANSAKLHPPVIPSIPTVTVNVDGVAEQIPVSQEPAVVPFNFSNIGNYAPKTATIDFGALSNSPQAESGASWNVYFDLDQNKPIIINANALSNPIRGDASEAYRAFVQQIPVMVIAVPYAHATIDQAYIGVNTTASAADSLQTNQTVIEIPTGQDLSAIRAMALPKMTITGTTSFTAGRTEQYTLTVVNNDGAVDTNFNDYFYVETTGGHLAVSKIKAVNGVATARLVGTDLLQGDEVTLKVGTKFFTSIAKLNITVTA